MERTLTGRIVKALSGFYYVHTPEGIFSCRARGKFRKDDIHPLVGDMADIDVTDEKDMEGNVVHIHERKSELSRPPVSNVDQALAVFAIKKPDINHNQLTRSLVALEIADIPPVIVFTKTDLVSDEDRERCLEIYGKCGYPILFVSSRMMEGIDEVRELLKGKLTTLVGPSGAGKSSLVNALLDESVAVTGDVSKKTGRGRQTTRHTELYALGDGAYIFDTPGFSSINSNQLSPEDLAYHFPEMRKLTGDCRFRSCLHLKEPDCAVKKAVEEGNISPVRYDDYVIIVDELRKSL